MSDDIEVALRFGHRDTLESGETWQKGGEAERQKGRKVERHKSRNAEKC